MAVSIKAAFAGNRSAGLTAGRADAERSQKQYMGVRRRAFKTRRAGAGLWGVEG
jgi:hypothetical protein